MITAADKHYRLTTYAQNREDLFLLSLFEGVENGFYVDVGANHPIKHSVTKLLYQKGWSGINIDPNKKLIALTTYDRERDTSLAVGVGDTNGELQFREYSNDGLSTMSDAMKTAYESAPDIFTTDYQDYTVPVLTLKEILTKHAGDRVIDLLKVDVEGFEDQVFAGNDWQRFRPRIICVEANHKQSDWHVLLVAKHYSKQLTDGLNDYYVADEHVEKVMALFDYAKTVLVYPHVIDNDMAGYVELIERRAEAAVFNPDGRPKPEVRALRSIAKELAVNARARLSLSDEVIAQKAKPSSHHVTPLPQPKVATELQQYAESIHDAYAQITETMASERTRYMQRPARIRYKLAVAKRLTGSAVRVVQRKLKARR